MRLNEPRCGLNDEQAQPSTDRFRRVSPSRSRRGGEVRRRRTRVDRSVSPAVVRAGSLQPGRCNRGSWPDRRRRRLVHHGGATCGSRRHGLRAIWARGSRTMWGVQSSPPAAPSWHASSHSSAHPSSEESSLGASNPLHGGRQMARPIARSFRGSSAVTAPRDRST